MAAKIITVSNQKGGVGKTTTSVSLAHYLAKCGQKVLLIDLDPQGQCATSMGMDPEQGVYYLLVISQSSAQEVSFIKKYVRDTGWENLQLIPGNQATGQAQANIQEKPISYLKEVVKTFAKDGIEDFEKAGSVAGGALPKFFRLTDRGRQAYWMLTGKNAVECEYDRLIKRHKTPEHTFLNLRTMDILEEIGDFVIVLQTPEIRLPDGSQFVPDIVAQKNGTQELIYVEVELGAGKDTEYRVQKWVNLCAASRGQIYVVCDTKKAVKAMTSEINSALAGYVYSSHLTDLEELQAKKRGKDGSMWIYQK